MHDDIKWFIGFLLVVGLIWFGGGGLHRFTTEKPFIKPFSTGGTGQTYGNGNTQAQKIQNEIKTVGASGSVSSLKGTVTIGSVRTVSPSGIGTNFTNNADQEYVQIRATSDNSAPILLSGMTLKSQVSGQTAVIGNGAYLIFPGTVNSEEQIYLKPGETAYITTGRSPVGYSFRLNKCSGYLAQSQQYTPYISAECPYAKNEPLPPPPNGINDQCLDYLDSIPQCTITPNPPNSLSHECQVFITTKINYPQCIAGHKNDADFYRGEWRVFLGRSDPIWKTRREIVDLLDRSGKVVDSYTY